MTRVAAGSRYLHHPTQSGRALAPKGWVGKGTLAASAGRVAGYELTTRSKPPRVEPMTMPGVAGARREGGAELMRRLRLAATSARAPCSTQGKVRQSQA